MPDRKVVVENLKKLSEEEKEQIRSAFRDVKGKIYVSTKKIRFLNEKFNQVNDSNLKLRCSKCRKRIIDFWKNVIQNGFRA